MARHKKKEPQFFKPPADLVAHLVRTAQPARDPALPPGADPSRSRYRFCPLCPNGRRLESTTASDELADHLRRYHDLDYQRRMPLAQHQVAARLQNGIAIEVQGAPRPYPTNWKYDQTRVPDWTDPHVQDWLSQWDDQAVIDDNYSEAPERGTARQIKIRMETAGRHRSWVNAWITERRDALRAAGFKLQLVPYSDGKALYVDTALFEIVKALVTDYRAMDEFFQCGDTWLAGVRHG